MRNLFLKIWSITALGSLLLIGGCGKKFDEAAFSKHLCSQLIVPAHAELVTCADRLDRAVEKFSRERDEQSLLAAQTEWNRTMAVLQRCKALNARNNKLFTDAANDLFALANRLLDSSKGNAQVLRSKNLTTLPEVSKKLAEKTRLLHTNWQQQETLIALQEKPADSAQSLFAMLSDNMEQLPATQKKPFSPTDRSDLYLYHHLSGLYLLFNGGIDKNSSYQGFYDYLCAQGKAEKAAEISLQFKKTLLAFEVLRGSALQDRPGREAFYREYEKLRDVLRISSIK